MNHKVALPRLCMQYFYSTLVDIGVNAPIRDVQSLTLILQMKFIFNSSISQALEK